MAAKFVANLLREQDKSGTIAYEGVYRQVGKQWWQKAPGSPAGWSMLAYRSYRSAEEAMDKARAAAEDAQKYELQAEACKSQAQAAQLQVALSARAVNTVPRTLQQRQLCDQLRQDVEKDPLQQEVYFNRSADVASLSPALSRIADQMKSCQDADLKDFCNGLKNFLVKEHPEVASRHEFVQLRKFCAGYESLLDEEAVKNSVAKQLDLQDVCMGLKRNLGYEHPVEAHRPEWNKLRTFCTEFTSLLQDSFYRNGGIVPQGDLKVFCKDLRHFLIHEHPEVVHEPQWVKLQRVCAAHQALLDESAEAQGGLVNDLLQRRWLTLYDMPPQQGYTPGREFAEPPWARSSIGVPRTFQPPRLQSSVPVEAAAWTCPGDLRRPSCGRPRLRPTAKRRCSVGTARGRRMLLSQFI